MLPQPRTRTEGKEDMKQDAEPDGGEVEGSGGAGSEGDIPACQLCIQTYSHFFMQTVNSDRAYDFIRKRILNGDYGPGSALMTEQLSAEIGVSRTPVRDALRQLESDGLVSIRPRLGASVKLMDRREFREMCELRLALEGHAAYLAAINRSGNELREIQQALEAMRTLTGRILAARKEACV